MLHQMGVLVAHGLTDESTSIEGLTLLDPNWLTTAIYALLADGELREREGIFDRAFFEMCFSDVKTLLLPPMARIASTTSST